MWRKLRQVERFALARNDAARLPNAELAPGSDVERNVRCERAGENRKYFAAKRSARRPPDSRQAVQSYALSFLITSNSCIAQAFSSSRLRRGVILLHVASAPALAFAAESLGEAYAMVVRRCSGRCSHRRDIQYESASANCKACKGGTRWIYRVEG